MKHRLAVILPAYLGMYALTYFAAYDLRFEFEPPPHMLRLFWTSLPFVLVLKLGLFLATGEWRRTYRYATLVDMLFVAAGATSAAALMAALNLTGWLGQFIPRTVILIDWAGTLLCGCLLRAAVRFYTELVRSAFQSGAKDRAVIFRSDSTGIAIYRAVQAGSSNFQIVGFLDDRVDRDSLLAGLPVQPVDGNWQAVLHSFEARHVLIPATVPGKLVRRILEECSPAGIKVHVIPAVDAIVDGRYRLQIREVSITDLLRREPAELDMDGIRDYITGRRVLVTGAAGSIGSELCRQLLALEPERLVLLDQSELGIFTMEQEFRDRQDSAVRVEYVIGDVTDEQTLERLMRLHQPELVFHAAAYKHVPLMEAAPQEAIRNNVLGTRNLVDQADRFGVDRFVFISTDKAVHPSSVMGATKLVAEKYLQAAASRSHTQYVTVRFGNVLNSAGSVVPTFRRQIEAGGPITVTHPDMERFFMTIPEAVQLVLQAGAIGHSGDVLVLEMGEPVKIVDLAKDMIFLSGLRYPDDIDIVFTGLRPGEKLSEELFYTSEDATHKVHDKIYCASRRGIAAELVAAQIKRLERAIDASPAEARRTLRDVVARLTVQEHRASPAHQRAA